ncbi:MAG TPA: FtsW/RodA/SpoVE family cell cycle protein [Fervidobacterium sp.]|nr:cell cycle protein [Fervidobacterium sp.]HOK88249.1 FtsW/RodA/SpoVE family cell cycle protein [Fervidobacterium sp.]HOM74303.1 FtsW/RodA/SpoVE family cell cycle protein [Fervidobacterium sp.]HOQ39836.1 FtsW/RodA/SpoVE family cell cycle protein [Fervidobacterium sp.]HPP17981.1 FtsW/RodA/SpoVE family cell cycle protein [Fervidobacterium sp.]
MEYKFKRLRENEFSIGDYVLIAVTITLMILGLVTLRSVVWGTEQQGRFTKQIIWDLVSLGIMLYIIFEKEVRIKKYGKYFYVLSVALLVLVLLIGKIVYGARRWIDIGPFDLQPSELFKISIILLLSEVLSHAPQGKKFLYSLFVVLPVVLVFLEPDLGMTVLILFLWFVMMMSSNINRKYILAILIIGVISAPILFYTVLKDYQRARILALFNPQEHFQYGAYNTIMSQVAIANGGIFGTGYNLGIATNMHMVPMQYTDFIFSAYAEQFGLVGSLILVGLYGTIILLSMIKIEKYKDEYWRYVVTGANCVFAFHVFENIGMNLGILPVTGIPLPFMSYGGTSTLVFSMLVGLLVKARAISKIARPVG